MLMLPQDAVVAQGTALCTMYLAVQEVVHEWRHSMRHHKQLVGALRPHSVCKSHGTRQPEDCIR